MMRFCAIRQNRLLFKFNLLGIISPPRVVNANLLIPSKIKAALNPESSNFNLKFEKKYGLLPEMIKNIEESTIGFIISMIQYQEAMKEINLIANEMKINFKQSKKLLTIKIDKFALLFESKNPQFYKEYSHAREKQTKKPVTEISEQDIEFQKINPIESDDKAAEIKSKCKIVPGIEE